MCIYIYNNKLRKSNIYIYIYILHYIIMFYNILLMVNSIPRMILCWKTGTTNPIQSWANEFLLGALYIGDHFGACAWRVLCTTTYVLPCMRYGTFPSRRRQGGKRQAAHVTRRRTQRTRTCANELQLSIIGNGVYEHDQKCGYPLQVRGNCGVPAQVRLSCFSCLVISSLQESRTQPY